METAQLLSELGSSLTSCGSGVVVFIVAFVTIFYLFRGFLQEPDSLRRPLSIFSIKHNGTSAQPTKIANQKPKHKTNKFASGKRASKSTTLAINSSKNAVTESELQIIHDNLTPPLSPLLEERDYMKYEKEEQDNDIPPAPLIEEPITFPPLELFSQEEAASESACQSPSILQQKPVYKKSLGKKQSQSRCGNKRNVEIRGGGSGFTTIFGNGQLCSINPSALTDMQTRVKELEKVLKNYKTDLESSRQETAKARSEVLKLRQSNDETGCTVETLRAKVTELAEEKSGIFEDKRIFEEKAKSLEISCCNLRSQLNLTATEAQKQKIRDANQIDDLKTKLAALMEHVQRQQRASSKEMAMSGENYCMLKARLDQANADLQQVKNANVYQQNELNSLRTTRMEEQMTSRNHMSNLNNLRVRNAQLEAQLQQCSLDLDRATQRNQEYGSALTSLQAELLDNDLKQSRVISSLQFQFGDLNSEKQRLSEVVLEQKSTSERSVAELRAQVLQLESDVETARAEALLHRGRADDLAARLEAEKKEAREATNAANITTSKPPPQPINGDDDDSMMPQGAEDQERLAKLEGSVAVAQREALEARRQQELLQNTLMQTESVLARLQRSVEEEEDRWCSKVAAVESENLRLRQKLAAMVTAPLADPTEVLELNVPDETSVLESRSKLANRIEPADALFWDDVAPDVEVTEAREVVDALMGAIATVRDIGESEPLRPSTP